MASIDPSLNGLKRKQREEKTTHGKEEEEEETNNVKRLKTRTEEKEQGEEKKEKEKEKKEEKDEEDDEEEKEKEKIETKEEKESKEKRIRDIASDFMYDGITKANQRYSPQFLVHWQNSNSTCSECKGMLEEKKSLESFIRICINALSPFSKKRERFVLRMNQNQSGLEDYKDDVSCLTKWNPNSTSDTSLDYPNIHIKAENILGYVYCEAMECFVMLFWSKKHVSMINMSTEHTAKSKLRFYMDSYGVQGCDGLYLAGPCFHPIPVLKEDPNHRISIF